MSERNTVVRSLHDLGLAAWFGGSLAGAVGFNGAAADVPDEKLRLRVANAAWAQLAADETLKKLLERFPAADANKDGKVTKQEFLKHHETIFDQIDANKDGAVDQPEADGYAAKVNAASNPAPHGAMKK